MAVPRTAPPPAPPKIHPEPKPKPMPRPAAKPAESKPTAKAGTKVSQEDLSPPVVPMVAPDKRKLADGKDIGMKPAAFPHPDKIRTFGDLAKAMAETTAGGRDLGKAVAVVQSMMADEGCFVVLTISGNATPFTELFAELIDRQIVHCVISTGSVITHSFSVERGRPMFKVEDPEAVDDNAFYNKGLNRIYDVVELETSLNEGYNILEEITNAIKSDTVTSAEITQRIGRHLNKEFPQENGLLHAAERNDVSVIVPAFSDCEVGLDFHAQNLEREREGRPAIFYDAFGDMKRYCALIKKAKSIGIIELGGGTPRNWGQQVGPFFDILAEKKLEPKKTLIRIKYAIRICSAPGTEAGLSGCSFSEGRSWGKFVPEDDGGQFAEVVGDYSLCFPLLVQAILEGV